MCVLKEVRSIIKEEKKITILVSLEKENYKFGRISIYYFEVYLQGLSHSYL